MRLAGQQHRRAGSCRKSTWIQSGTEDRLVNFDTGEAARAAGTEVPDPSVDFALDVGLELADGEGLAGDNAFDQVADRYHADDQAFLDDGRTGRPWQGRWQR